MYSRTTKMADRSICFPPSPCLKHPVGFPISTMIFLMNLTIQLTNGYAEIKKLFRLMCFNLFAHDRDDHFKKFSFYKIPQKKWPPSPAHNLTYSSSIGEEQVATINGNGLNPESKISWQLPARSGWIFIFLLLFPHHIHICHHRKYHQRHRQ